MTFFGTTTTRNECVVFSWATSTGPSECRQTLIAKKNFSLSNEIRQTFAVGVIVLVRNNLQVHERLRDKLRKDKKYSSQCGVTNLTKKILESSLSSNTPNRKKKLISTIALQPFPVKCLSENSCKGIMHASNEKVSLIEVIQQLLCLDQITHRNSKNK